MIKILTHFTHITTKEKEVQRALGTLSIWRFNINLCPYDHTYVHHLCVEAPTMLIAQELAQEFCENSKGRYSIEHMFRESKHLSLIGYNPVEVIALLPGECSTVQWLASILIPGVDDDIAGWENYAICEKVVTISGYKCVIVKSCVTTVKVEDVR